jgi:hypothetical protein
MRTFITALLLFTCHAAVSQPPFVYQRDFKPILEQTQDKASPLSYQKLLIRFLDNDSTLSNAETLALLIGYTEDSHYKPFEDMEKEQEVFDLNEEGNVEDALIKAKAYLQTHPLSLRVLKEASYCYHTLKKEDSANYYMDLVDKIMNAMTYSGNGKKPETPMFSLGLADGEYFIPNIGMKVLNRDTDWNSSNLFLEIIDASKSGEDHILYYFVIQHAKNKIDDDKVNESGGKKKKKDDKKKKDKKDKGWKNKPGEETTPPQQ